jgi:chaperone required for assembly of F1-ATPase
MIRRFEEPLKDPLASARRLAKRVRPARFYRDVSTERGADGFALLLDGRRTVTPGRNPLVVPDAGVASAIEAEWRAQAAEIDAAAMPVTRLANSAIDAVAPRMAEVRDEILAYAKTDLVYYRAGGPDGLVKRQAAAWDPVVAWAERRFKIRFILAEGMRHVAQLPDTLAAISRELAEFEDAFRLAGLHVATTLTGSALIALALAQGELTVDQAWAAAHVDEDWNIFQWGEDAEAAALRARRLEDFRAAALALAPGQPGQ